MKKIFTFCFYHFCKLLLCSTGDETAVRQLLNDQTQAWNRGDIDSFMKTYWESDSLTFIGKKRNYLWLDKYA
jgi:hypothetical protein